MRTPLEGRSYIILTFIGIIVLFFILPLVSSIPLWSNSSAYPSSPQGYNWRTTYLKTYNFTINWTDSVSGVGAISNVTFETNFTSTFKNYTIGVNITGGNNTQGIWWVNLTQIDIPAGTFVYRWYAKNSTDTEYTNSSDSFTYTVTKRTVGSSSDSSTTSSKYPSTTNITIEELNNGDSDVVYRLWVDGINVINSSGVINYTTILGAGNHNYTLTHTEGVNYTSATYSLTEFSVAKGNHQITILLNGSSSNQTYEKGSIANITIVSNATIDNITASMSIYANFTGTNQSISSISGSILNSLYNLTDTSNLALGTYIISANISETQNYSSATNMSLILTVADWTPPTIRLYSYTNATFKKSSNILTLNISVSDNSVLNDNCSVRIANSSSTANISGITNVKSGWCNGTITIPSDVGSDGNKTINITFYDGNNTGVNSSFVVWLDNNPPAVSISVSPTTAYVGDTIHISTSASDASGIASQTVTVTKPNGVSTSVGSTYTPDQGGTYTAGMTATDNAGNSASASASFTIYQYSSSLPPSSAPTKTNTFNKIILGEVKTMKVDENIGITQIEISVKSVAEDVIITVKKLDKKPDYVKAELSDRLYRYFEITHQNIQDKLEKVKIKFKVEKSWLASNSIDESKVNLQRYADNKWNKLSTTKLSEDANYTYFESVTKSLSVFAVSGEEKIILVPKEKPVGNITIPEEEKIPERVEEEPEKPKVPFSIYIISIVAVILLLALLLLKSLRRKRKH